MALEIEEGSDLEAAVYMTLGYASRCWDDEGVFQSELAAQAGQALIDYVNERYEERANA